MKNGFGRAEAYKKTKNEGQRTKDKERRTKDKKRTKDERRNFFFVKMNDCMFLLIFNPSNDMALAADAQMYVPPRNVRQMEKDLELFPLAWAEDGDAVLGKEDDLGIEGKRDSVDFSQYVPKPWGWSKSLKQRLLRLGVLEENMPSDEQLDWWRRWSSREFAAKYIQQFLGSVEQMNGNRTCDVFVGEDMRFCQNVSDLRFQKGQRMILKSPWSSSGRGVFVAENMNEKTLTRIEGVLRNQGGILVDRYYHKVLDFALEFDAQAPRVVVCVPSGVTEVEKRSVIDATEEAGARHTYLIEEPIAAAIGAGIDISQPRGNMVVDIGGGTTDVAIISLGGSVLSESIKVAGDKFDEAIVRYMRKKHNLLIGERTAEDMKIRIGSAYPRKEQLYIDVKGRNLISGLPQAITIGSNEMIDALEEPLQNILETIRNLFEKTPPELASDIAENGICLTGGGALLYGMDKFVAEHTKVPCYVAEDPISCVAIGTGKVLDNIEKYSISAIYDYKRGDYFEA